MRGRVGPQGPPLGSPNKAPQAGTHTARGEGQVLCPGVREGILEAWGEKAAGAILSPQGGDTRGEGQYPGAPWVL